jgi:hypothetical protein
MFISVVSGTGRGDDHEAVRRLDSDVSVEEDENPVPDKIL